MTKLRQTVFCLRYSDFDLTAPDERPIAHLRGCVQPFHHFRAKCPRCTTRLVAARDGIHVVRELCAHAVRYIRLFFTPSFTPGDSGVSKKVERESSKAEYREIEEEKEGVPRH